VYHTFRQFQANAPVRARTSSPTPSSPTPRKKMKVGIFSFHGAFT